MAIKLPKFKKLLRPFKIALGFSLKIIKVVLDFFVPKITWKSAVLSSLHSIWLIAVSLLWLGHANIMDGFGFMNDYVNFRTFVNHVVLQKPPPPDIAENFLLINTSRNNQIVPLDNDNTINKVITDRRLLAEKLSILDQNSDRIAFVLCDVFFDSPSGDYESDSLLQEVIMSLSKKGKFAMPAYYNDAEKELIEPIFAGKTGLSQYRSSYLNKQFLKFSLIAYGQYTQLPLIAFQSVHGKKLEKRRLGIINYYTTSGRLSLNTIIPAFRYTQANLVEGLNYYHLGLFEDYFIGEDQVVIIGDFAGLTDVHHTIADFSSGALVLLNIYAALVNGDNQVSAFYLLLLFLVFFYVSYHTLFYKRKILTGKTRMGRIFSFFANKLNYLILIVLVYVSMILFSHYIHFLILLSYFALLDFGKLLIIKRRKRRKSRFSVA